MSFNDSEQAIGAPDIRGLFDQYIGDYALVGKTVLDVGTASGFIAFDAEKTGALVTALEHRDVAGFLRPAVFIGIGGCGYRTSMVIE